MLMKRTKDHIVGSTGSECTHLPCTIPVSLPNMRFCNHGYTLLVGLTTIKFSVLQINFSLNSCSCLVVRVLDTGASNVHIFELGNVFTF